MKFARALRTWLFAAPLLVSACSWNTGMQAPMSRHGKPATIGIEIFTTDRERVLERDLEPLLHAELSRAVSDLVAAPLAKPAKADLILRGTILEYRRRSGVRRATSDIKTLPGGAPAPENRFDLLESGVHILAVAELVDRRTGEIVVPAKTYGSWSGYSISPSEEAAARDRVLAHVAETLVLELFASQERTGENPGRPDE